jgi:hypothetical protein
MDEELFLRVEHESGNILWIPLDREAMKIAAEKFLHEYMDIEDVWAEETTDLLDAMVEAGRAH